MITSALIALAGVVVGFAGVLTALTHGYYDRGVVVMWFGAAMIVCGVVGFFWNWAM